MDGSLTGSRAVRRALVALSLLAPGVVAADEAPPPRLKPSAGQQPWEAQGAAHRGLLEKAGRQRLTELTKGDDTSLALQSAWELNKKLLKRDKTPQPEIEHTDLTYDPVEMRKFIAFVEERTKASVPEWWDEWAMNLNVLEGQWHFRWGKRAELNKFIIDDRLWYTPSNTSLHRQGRDCVYRFGTAELRLNRDVLEWPPLDDAIGHLASEKVTYLVRYDTLYARSRVSAFDSATSERIWFADTWPVRVLKRVSRGVHRVELVKSDRAVLVFGAETNGLYIEAFDLATGKNVWRFSSSYWGNYSEAWTFK